MGICHHSVGSACNSLEATDVALAGFLCLGACRMSGWRRRLKGREGELPRNKKRGPPPIRTRGPLDDNPLQLCPALFLVCSGNLSLCGLRRLGGEGPKKNHRPGAEWREAVIRTIE